jgi:hypothetical protein
MSPRLRHAALIAVLAFAACSADDAGDGGGAGLGTTSSIAPPVAPSVPAESPSGTGLVLIGELGSSFKVTSCDLDVGGATTGELLRLEGAGTRANGVPFTVEAVRSASDEAAEAFTDLITYTDTARILQVQRSEVAGEVTDLRDPDARGPLLRVRADGLSATGIAGPPGTRAPEGPGLVGLALDASC